MAGISPQRKDGIWYLIRRVPDRFRSIDKRTHVKLTTRIRVADDPRGVRAHERVQELNGELEAYWEALLDGKNPHAARSFEDATRRAIRLGVQYKPASELAQGPLEEIARRLELLERKGLMDSPKAVEAILGGLEPAPIMLSGLLREHENDVRASLTRMSPHQLHRWRLAKQRAVNNLVDVIGDKPLKDITRADAVTFRDWWENRIIKEGLDIETANKDIGHLNKMMRTLENKRQLGLQAVFANLRLEGARAGQRVAFDPAFIQERILAEGALSTLNPEARRIVYVCIETGMRPVEVANLLPEHIHLDAPVPYVEVKAAGRVLKTDHSERKIPLVGVALEAMLKQPGGFPKYRDKSQVLSATVNKFLLDHGLRPEPGQSFYSFRHAFEDRLTAVEAPEKIIANLMGHKWHRPKYGRGPTLDHIREWLRRIAFRAPRKV